MTNTLFQGVGQISIPVHDLENAIAFYKEKLSLPLLFNTDRMAFFNCSGVRLLLSLPEIVEFEYFSTVVYFKVYQIKEAYGDLYSWVFLL